MQLLNYAFKIVCVDENNPVAYTILDEVNKGNMLETCKYLQDNYSDYDLNKCKWIIIPIPKQ